MKTKIIAQQCVKYILIFCTLSMASYSQADINQSNLGAKYSVDNQQLNFRIYSASATKIELYLYNQATGAEEIAQYSLSKDNNNIWSISLASSNLNANLNGTIYYGYRAWGANWTYDTAWQKGSNLGFISDVDAQGNRFNPNKLLADPYAKELSHDHLTLSLIHI